MAGRHTLAGNQRAESRHLMGSGHFTSTADTFFAGFPSRRASRDCLASMKDIINQLESENSELVMSAKTGANIFTLPQYYSAIRNNLGRLDRDLKGLHSLRCAALSVAEGEVPMRASEMIFDLSKQCAASVLNTSESADWTGLAREDRLKRIATCHGGTCDHWAGWTSPPKQLELAETFIKLKVAFARLEEKSVHGTSDPDGFLDAMCQSLLGSDNDEKRISNLQNQARQAQSSTWSTLPSNADEPKQIELATLIAGFYRQKRYTLAKSVNETLEIFRSRDRVLENTDADTQYGFDTDEAYLEGLRKMQVGKSIDATWIGDIRHYKHRLNPERPTLFCEKGGP